MIPDNRGRMPFHHTGFVRGSGAFNISEPVRQSIGQLQVPAAKDAPSGSVTASVATATAVPQHESAWEELDLIKAARHALREARATGGNRVLRANLGMAERA